MAIARGQPIIGTDVQDLCAVWGNSRITDPGILKGLPFNWADQIYAAAVAFVTMHYPPTPTSKNFDTGDPIVGVQNFTLDADRTVPPNDPLYSLVGFPVVGSKLQAPTKWATCFLDGNAAQKLDSLTQLGALITTTIGGATPLGAVISSYLYIDHSWPGDGGELSAYMAYVALIAMK